MGYLFCEGTDFFEYELTLDEDITKVLEKTMTLRYSKPLTENFQVNKIIIGQQYIMLNGDFGMMSVSREAWAENQLLPALTK